MAKRKRTQNIDAAALDGLAGALESQNGHVATLDTPPPEAPPADLVQEPTTESANRTTIVIDRGRAPSKPSANGNVSAENQPVPVPPPPAWTRWLERGEIEVSACRVTPQSLDCGPLPPFSQVQDIKNYLRDAFGPGRYKLDLSRSGVPIEAKDGGVQFLPVAGPSGSGEDDPVRVAEQMRKATDEKRKQIASEVEIAKLEKQKKEIDLPAKSPEVFALEAQLTELKRLVEDATRRPPADPLDSMTKLAPLLEALRPAPLPPPPPPKDDTQFFMLMMKMQQDSASAQMQVMRELFAAKQAQPDLAEQIRLAEERAERRAEKSYERFERFRAEQSRGSDIDPKAGFWNLLPMIQTAAGELLPHMGMFLQMLKSRWESNPGMTQEQAMAQAQAEVARQRAIRQQQAAMKQMQQAQLPVQQNPAPRSPNVTPIQQPVAQVAPAEIPALAPQAQPSEVTPPPVVAGPVPQIAPTPSETAADTPLPTKQDRHDDRKDVVERVIRQMILDLDENRNVSLWMDECHNFMAQELKKNLCSPDHVRVKDRLAVLKPYCDEALFAELEVRLVEPKKLEKLQTDLYGFMIFVNNPPVENS